MIARKHVDVFIILFHCKSYKDSNLEIIRNADVYNPSYVQYRCFMVRATDQYTIMPRLHFLQDSEDNTRESRMWGRVQYCFDSKAK